MADETKPDQAAAAAAKADADARAKAQADASAAKAKAEADAAKAAADAKRTTSVSNPDAAASAMTPARPGRRPGPAETAAPPPQVDTQALGSAIAAGYAQIQAQREQLTATEGMDRTVPHGCYIVEGRVVNAHGEELDLDPDDLEGMTTHGPDAPTEPAPLRKDRAARRQPETKEI